MGVGIRGMKGLTLKHGTLKLLLTICFHQHSMKYFCNPNYKQLDLHTSQNPHFEF